jgi:hypothetical protein
MLRRLVPALAVGLLALLVAASPVAANEPGALDFIDWEPHPMRSMPPEAAEQPAPASRVPVPPRPSATLSPTTRPTPSPTPTPIPSPEVDAVGYDISYPQCGRDYPESFAFAIVGVDGGRVFTANPCFAPGGRHPSQLAWAGEEAELYFNTGNPGPRSSRHWPAGQAEPRACGTGSSTVADTADCAFVYGWNAAEDSYRRALEAYAQLEWVEANADRLPADTMIWLDVEVANTWRFDWGRNLATLEGAVAYLESMGTERIGFYSTPRMWLRIVGLTDAFQDYPGWHAGARDRQDAERRCREERAFTGGDLVMVQWVEDRLDHNVRCADLEPSR